MPQGMRAWTHKFELLPAIDGLRTLRYSFVYSSNGNSLSSFHREKKGPKDSMGRGQY